MFNESNLGELDTIYDAKTDGNLSGDDKVDCRQLGDGGWLGSETVVLITSVDDNGCRLTWWRNQSCPGS